MKVLERLATGKTRLVLFIEPRSETCQEVSHLAKDLHSDSWARLRGSDHSPKIGDMATINFPLKICP